MRGHIKKYEGKNGITWTVHYYLGYSDMGKKRYTTKRGFATKKQAEAFLADITTQLHEGMYRDTSKDTLSEFLQKWLDYKRDTVRLRSIEIYERTIRLHIEPRLGRIKLADLRPIDLRNLYMYLQRDSGLSKRTVSQIHTLLHDAFDRAVKWEVIQRNITDAVDAPRPERKRFEIWTLADTRRFLAAPEVTGHRFYIPFLLAVTTGMRQGEILALRWRNIDLDNGILHVEHTLTKENNVAVFGPPKSESGRRDISLGPEVVDALRSHKARQNAERLEKGSAYSNQDLVVARLNGNMVTQTFLRQKFIDLIEQLEMPYIRFHDMRHTHASLLMELGEDMKVIQEQLGHATIGITADTYTHLSKTVKSRPAQLISTALFGGKK